MTVPQYGNPKRYQQPRKANTGEKKVAMSKIPAAFLALTGGVGFGHYMGAAAVAVRKQLRAKAKREKERKPPQIDRPPTRKEKKRIWDEMLDH